MGALVTPQVSLANPVAPELFNTAWRLETSHFRLPLWLSPCCSDETLEVLIADIFGDADLIVVALGPGVLLLSSAR